MPWRCPACREAIRHNPIEAEPQIGVTYRCPICRLELVFDPIARVLTVTHLSEDHVTGQLAQSARETRPKRNKTRI
jgi:hypothetical protein